MTSLHNCKPIINEKNPIQYDITYNKNLYSAVIDYEKYDTYQFPKCAVNLYVFRELVEKNISNCVPILDEKDEIRVEIPIFGDYLIKIPFAKTNLSFSTAKRIKDLETEVEKLKGIIENRKDTEILVSEFILPEWKTYEQFQKLPEYKYIQISENWKEKVFVSSRPSQSPVEIFHDRFIAIEPYNPNSITSYRFYVKDKNGNKYVIPVSIREDFLETKTHKLNKGDLYICVQNDTLSGLGCFISLNKPWMYQNKGAGIYYSNEEFKKYTSNKIIQNNYHFNPDTEDIIVPRKLFESSEPNNIICNYFGMLAFGYVIENIDIIGRYELTFKIIANLLNKSMKLEIYKSSKKTALENVGTVENPNYICKLSGHFEFETIFPW